MGHCRGGHSGAWATEAGSLLHQRANWGRMPPAVEAGSGQQARLGTLVFSWAQWAARDAYKAGVTVIEGGTEERLQGRGWSLPVQARAGEAGPGAARRRRRGPGQAVPPAALEPQFSHLQDRGVACSGLVWSLRLPLKGVRGRVERDRGGNRLPVSSGMWSLGHHLSPRQPQAASDKS